MKVVQFARNSWGLTIVQHCCKTSKWLFTAQTMLYNPDKNTFEVYSLHPHLEINYCPTCGEKIELLPRDNSDYDN